MFVWVSLNLSCLEFLELLVCVNLHTLSNKRCFCLIFFQTFFLSPPSPLKLGLWFCACCSIWWCPVDLRILFFFFFFIHLHSFLFWLLRLNKLIYFNFIDSFFCWNPLQSSSGLFISVIVCLGSRCLFDSSLKNNL